LRAVFGCQLVPFYGLGAQKSFIEWLEMFICLNFLCLIYLVINVETGKGEEKKKTLH
jgi:hypothetical protein